MENNRLTPRYFMEMRRSQGKVCPNCGGENTCTVAQFERDHQINDQKQCDDCGYRYSYIHMKK